MPRTLSVFEWQIPLFDRMNRPETKAVNDWNRLEIVTQGDVYWFLINGTVIGSIQDARIGSEWQRGSLVGEYQRR